MNRKILRASCLLLSIILLCSIFAGCEKDNPEQENNAAQVYIDMAQDYIESGNYEAAIDVLEKGYTSTGDEQIKTLLQEVIANQPTNPTEPSAPQGTEPTTAVPPASSAPATPPSEPTPPATIPPTQTTPVTTPSTNVIPTPNIEQIKRDLIAAKGNVFTINNEKVALSFESAEILRRKSTTEYDEVYITAVLKNNYYIVNAEYTLFYSYYTVGGWHLDQYQTTNHQSKAVANPVSNDAFVSFMETYFSKCTISARQHEIDDNGVFNDTITFIAILEYKYLSAYYSCSYNMVFYDDYWHESFECKPLMQSWSNMLGTWQYVHPNGDYLTLTFEKFKSLDWTTLYITYSYSSSPWNWLRHYNTNNTNFYCPSTTKTEPLQTEKLTILGVTVEVPIDIFIIVKLGNNPNYSESPAHLSFDRDTGATMVYWDNPQTGTSVSLEKIS